MEKSTEIKILLGTVCVMGAGIAIIYYLDRKKQKAAAQTTAPAAAASPGTVVAATPAATIAPAPVNTALPPVNNTTVTIAPPEPVYTPSPAPPVSAATVTTPPPVVVTPPPIEIAPPPVATPPPAPATTAVVSVTPPTPVEYTPPPAPAVTPPSPVVVIPVASGPLNRITTALGAPKSFAGNLPAPYNTMNVIDVYYTGNASPNFNDKYVLAYRVGQPNIQGYVAENSAHIPWDDATRKTLIHEGTDPNLKWVVKQDGTLVYGSF